MERKEKIDPNAIRFKKIGGGSFHATINGETVIIKPNQEFWAQEEEIPLAFRDAIVPVDPIAASRKKKEVNKTAEAAASPKYSLEERGGNWWNVVSEDGKVQNESALRKPAAEELLKSLS